MTTILLRTFLIYIFLNFMMRLMGKRQIGEMELTELITTLILSEIAAIPIENPDIPLSFTILPTVLIVSLEVILSFLKNKSRFLKHWFEGKPSFLIEKGVLNQKEFLRLRISMEEFMGKLRQQGRPGIDGIDYAILESNGQLSVIPYDNPFSKEETINNLPEEKEATSATTRAGNEKKRQNDEAGNPSYNGGIFHSLIVDGKIDEHLLGKMRKTMPWLLSQTAKVALEPKDIFYFGLNDKEEVHIIPKGENAPHHAFSS